MTLGNENNYRHGYICWFCELPLKGRRLRGHCHPTRKYRGAAHEK